MHIFRWKHYYLFVLLVVFIFLVPKLISVYNALDTKNITVASNFSSLDCTDVALIETKDKTKTLYETPLYSDFLDRRICTIDHLFSDSDEDRAFLLGFIEYRLKNPFVRRYDIAEYFYRRIIKANENDALSLYIKQEKLIK